MNEDNLKTSSESLAQQTENPKEELPQEVVTHNNSQKTSKNKKSTSLSDYLY